MSTQDTSDLLTRHYQQQPTVRQMSTTDFQLKRKLGKVVGSG
ncbi:unnamed protein product [Schistosoma mattheei]|uniref:Uncharacterized protein n=1 Tax=Schistosoma mattheei TaxID=31246 RepID=A0A3P7XBJ8_9TREM|nr:unnamed protein product [Schistosoma mattheei]